MKKVLIGIGAALGLAILGLVGAAAMQDDTTHVERSIVVDAKPADLEWFTQDLKGINSWSPWEGKDPDQAREYSDPSSGVGAIYHWDGNDEVGEGTMTIKSIEEGKVVIDLHFIEPFETDAVITISYAAEGDGTKVTWALDQENGFGSKVMMVFMDWEDMLGPDFEKGLALLKPKVEQAAREGSPPDQAS